MKILMLTPYLPYPLWSGGQIRTYNLLKNLSDKHDITLFSFIRDEKEKKYISDLKNYCRDVRVFLKRPPWSIKSLTLSAVTFYPLVVCMYLNREVREEIRKKIEVEKFDLIHAETFYVMPNIPKTSIPKILVEQTIEHLVYQHYTEEVKFLPKKLLMKWDVVKIKYWEKKFWHEANRVVAMSEADRQMMIKHDNDLKVDLVPNGVDLNFFPVKKAKKGDKTILFVGNFKWLQNREAVNILVKKIWPEIQAKLNNVRLWIVGRSPTPEILSYSRGKITVSSDIADIRKAYLQSDILLAPIYGPGGTRYKILEAMATGLPVVTTTTGIEGIGAINGKHAIFHQDENKLAEASVKILSDKKTYQTLAKNARILVSKNFNWKSIAAKLDDIYQYAAKGN